MDNIKNASAAFKVVETPKLQSACSGCMEYVTNCRYCGSKSEILDHKVLDYHAGSAHRCGGGRV